MGVRLVVHNFLYDEMDYTGTHNHEEMLHRDWSDQHPIYAISGLQEVLNTIETNIAEIIETLIANKNELKQYTDDEIDAESAIINERIDGLNVINDVQDTHTIDLTYESDKILKADVKIYDDPDGTNSLVKTEDGLYVPKLVTRESDTIIWDEISYGKTLQELFDDGIRFSHQSTTVYNNMFRPSDANAWYWDDNLQSFVQPLNADSYNGIVTKDFYENYKHSVRLLSNDGDDDANGIILGFVFDEFGNPHTLSAMIQRGGSIYLNYRFAIIYNFQLPGQTIVASYNLLNSNGGWNAHNTNGITLYAVKNRNSISVSATAWDYVNTNTSIDDAALMPFEATLNIDLDDYSWGYLFDNKVRYGYSNLSQANSYFDHVFFYSTNSYSSADVVANVKVREDENNAIEVDNHGMFVKKFLISQEENNSLVEKEDGYFVMATAMYVSDTRLNGLVHEGEGYYYVHKSHSFITVDQEDHGFDVGDFIYFDHRTEKYQKATAIDSFDINIVGMVSYIYDTDKFEYVCSGFVETDIFNTEHQFVQGMPLYISDTEPGKVTQQQPDISKAVGYPVGDIGLIISIERGIQYGQEATIGDFKTSANDYNIRSDGFIKIADNIEYKLSLVQRLVNALDNEFLDTYTIIDNENNIFKFQNSEMLYELNEVSNGINLFIKAF